MDCFWSAAKHSNKLQHLNRTFEPEKIYVD